MADLRRVSTSASAPSTISARCQQHDRHGRGARAGFRSDLAEDVHRPDLGLERQVARDQHDRAELADRSREAERRRPRGSPGSGSAARSAATPSPAPRPARPRPPPSSGRARSAPAAPSAPRTAASRTTSASAIAARVNAMSMPSGPSLPYSASSTNPADDRRQRERQVDQRVDDALARELVAHEHPGDQRPEASR